MGICDAQRLVKEDWEKKSNAVDEKAEILFLMEEVGEMAEAIRKNIYGKDKNISAAIYSEMGDVLVSILTLANRYNINLEQAFLDSMKKIDDRRK